MSPLTNSNEEMPPPLSRMFRQLSLSIYLPAFLMSMCQGSVLLILPLFALDLGANAGITALVFSMRGLGNVLSDVPAGHAAARLGDKVTMLIGIGIMASTSFAASFAGSPTGLAAAAFALGAGMAVWLLGRLTHVAEAVPGHHRGKAIATMAGVQRFGNLIGPVASGVLATYFGFSVVFMVIAAFASIAFLFVVLFVPQNRRSQEAHHTPLLKIVPVVLREHSRIFLSAGLSMFLLTILRAARQLMIPLWGESIGLSHAEIGYVMGAAAAVDMCMFPLAGYVMDNMGRKPAAMGCLFFLALGLTLVPFTQHAMSLGLAAMVVGFGNGLGSGINMTLGADFSPDGKRAEFLGVWRLIGDAGSFGGPLLLGAITQALVLSTAFSLAAIIGGLGIAIIWTAVKEPLQSMTHSRS